MDENEYCSVACKLKLKSCSAKSSEKEVSSLSVSEKELFEFRSGLAVNDVTCISTSNIFL